MIKEIILCRAENNKTFHYLKFCSAENLDAQLKVSAITAIKEKYQVHKNWMGDPCVPNSMAWDGLTCSYAVSSPPRITSL